jgi:ribose transport system ATP-binding protein
VVMRNGRIAAQLGRDELSEKNLVSYAVGDAGRKAVSSKQEHQNV